MSFLRTKDKRKRRVSPEDVLEQIGLSRPMQKALEAVENMRPGDSAPTTTRHGKTLH